MTDRIEGKVAKILTDRRLVINRGSDSGVREGTRFAILSSSNVDVSDPDTGEELGTLDVARTIVKVTAVYPRMCVAKAFRTMRTSGIFTGFTKPTERHETFRAENTAESEIDETQSKVSVGDRAVQVVGEEFEGMVLGF